MPAPLPRSIAAALLVTLAAALAAPAAAQQPVAILRGRDLVSIDSGEVVSSSPKLVPRRSRHFGGSRFGAGDELIDAAADLRVRVHRDRAVGFHLDGKARWVTEVTLPEGLHAERMWLTEQFVLLPHSGATGVHALARDDGRVAWQVPTLPNAVLLVDGDLLIAAGTVDGKPKLAAVATSNGAAAFVAELPAAATQLAANQFGILARCGATVLGVARDGPGLFRLELNALQIAATRDAFAVLTGTELHLFDRRGRPLWSRPLVAGHDNSWQLLPLADDHLAVLGHHTFSDSGMRVAVHRLADGAVLWRRNVNGLGVAHSKYWHECFGVDLGKRLVVVSNAAGGAFHVVLDAADGELVARH